VGSGPPLGAFPWDYEIHRLALAREESLIVYTDGVIEARRGGELFAEEGVVQTLAALGSSAAPKRLAEGLAEAARGYAGRLQDDLQVVAVRFLGRTLTVGQSALPRLKMTVPMAPWRLTDVRGSARDFLTAHEVPEQIAAEVVLCIEEACTNALRHSGSLNPTDLTLCIRDEVVEAVVQDDGIGFDVERVDLGRPPDLMATGGRGLYLIHSLVDELQVSCDGGTRVAMKRSLTRRSRGAVAVSR
jgi:anti-sigma regulatory factor (Ser/Thr protein kinase)